MKPENRGAGGGARVAGLRPYELKTVQARVELSLESAAPLPQQFRGEYNPLHVSVWVAEPEPSAGPARAGRQKRVHRGTLVKVRGLSLILLPQTA